MALFKMRTWKDRKSEYPTRRELTREDGTTELVTVARSEGTISQEGDAFSGHNMNDLESRISKAIGTGDIPAELGEDIISAINSLNTGMAVATSGNYQGLICSYESGLGVYIEISTRTPEQGMKYHVTCARAGVYGVGWSTAGKAQYAVSGGRILLVVPISGNFSTSSYLGHIGTADLIITYDPVIV